MNRKATLICDMQYGSTGKGLIAGYLAEQRGPDVLMTAWSMNAGHTYINRAGRKMVHCMLANGVVSGNLRYVLVGPGSQIGVAQLLAEVDECRDLMGRAEVLIHPHACVIQERHVEEEAGPMTRIGSTKKGCGAALIEKIRRNPDSAIVAKHLERSINAAAADLGVRVRVCTATEYAGVIESADRIHVEGAQGYSLGINSGFYPYVTSRECTPAQICSDVALPLPLLGEVIGTMRTFPIRVANRYDENGNQIGWSGPGYEDQREITFESIGQEPELTTVTRLPRRIFTFSPQQCYEAMRHVRPDAVVLGFANYCGADTLRGIEETINETALKFGCGGVGYLTWGPTAGDVQEVNRAGLEPAGAA